LLRHLVSEDVLGKAFKEMILEKRIWANGFMERNDFMLEKDLSKSFYGKE